MNILFINHENILGGATKSLLNLIDELKINKDIKIYVAVTELNNNPKNSLLSELKKRNIKYLYMGAYWWMYPDNESNKKIKNIIRFVVTLYSSLKLSFFAKKNKIDIIHSNSSVIYIGLLINKFTHIPHMYHIREFGKEDHNYNYIINKSKCYKLMNKYSNEFICISSAIYNKFIKVLDKEKCKVIYNGVKIDKKYKKIKLKKDKSYNILIAGTIKKNKRQLDAIRAIKILVNKGYTNIKLYIVGNSNEDYLKILKDFTDKNNLSKNILFIDYVDNLNELRDNIDIELMCSKCEAFGRVTIEAMLNSNVVVGNNTGATKELIINNETGLLYDDNYVDLALKIELLINDYNLRSKLSENAYNYARNNFTSKINANKILMEYKYNMKKTIE